MTSPSPPLPASAMRRASASGAIGLPRLRGASHVMKAAASVSREEAQASLLRQFHDPSSLDNIAARREEAERDLAAANSQLSGVVHAKLDGIKRAMDTIDECQDQISALRRGFRSVDALTQRTDTSLSKYPRVKALNKARKNLQQTLQQVEFFAQIPARAQALKSLLAEKPNMLKYVYVEARKLEKWRDALMKEVQENEAAERISKETSQRIRLVLGDYFGIIFALSNDIRHKLKQNIGNCYELATENPTQLVRTVEVIELHEQFQERMLEKARQAAADEDDVPFMPEELRSIAITRLQRSVENRVQSSFARLHMEAADKGEVGVAAVLGAASQLLGDLAVFKNEIAPCFPPSYGVMDLCLRTYNTQLVPQVAALYQDESSLEVSDLLRLIEWLDYYVHQMHVLQGGAPGAAMSAHNDRDDAGGSDRPSIASTTSAAVSGMSPVEETCAEFTQAAGQLKQQYLEKTQSQIVEWFDNINANEAEVMRANNGELITSVPEDMFNALHMQMEVAMEQLSPEHLLEVLVAFLNVLRDLQRKSYDSLSTQWRSRSVDLLCATVNDYRRMMDKCDEFASAVSPKLNPDGRDMASEVVSDLSTEYIQLAKFSASLVVNAIQFDMYQPVFQALFTEQWETGDEFPVATACATYEDYWADVRQFIQTELFLRQVMHELLEKTVSSYVHELRLRGRSNHKFGNAIRAAARIRADATEMRDFFCELSAAPRRKTVAVPAGILDSGNEAAMVAAAAAAAASTRGTSGIADVSGKLDILDHIVQILSATMIAAEQSAVLAVFREFKCQEGQEFLDVLVDMRDDLEREERQEQHDYIRKMASEYAKTDEDALKPIASRFHHSRCVFASDGDAAPAVSAYPSFASNVAEELPRMATSGFKTGAAKAKRHWALLQKTVKSSVLRTTKEGANDDGEGDDGGSDDDSAGGGGDHVVR